MAINASIITDTAKDITKRMVVDYGAGVFAHTTQDWSEHNVVRAYPTTSFVSSGATVSTGTLRLQATRDDGSSAGQSLVLAVPIISAGTTAITNSVPIIIQQPSSMTVAPASLVQMIVAAISDIPLTYQWQKQVSSVWTDLSGKTTNNLVLPSVTESESGLYRVIVTNANGSVVSSTATLLVATGGAFISDDSPFYESLPGVRLFNAIFG